MTRETSALNVLMVIPRYFPYMGGTETHVHEIGRCPVNSGDKVTLLTTVPRTGPLPRVEVLLRAYATMESQVSLVLIGRAVEVFSMGFPPNVRVLHNRPHEAVMQAWSRCTIALVSSICLEPFGIVALGAMGRPVVASRIGGLADIVVDGETGFLVAPGNPCTLRDAIQRLLDDPMLRERMGTMAKRRAAEFYAGAVVPRIERVYQEVLYS